MKINTKKITAVGLATIVLGTPIGAFADEETLQLEIDTSVEVDTTDLEEEISELEIESEEEDTQSDLDDSEKEHFLTKEGATLKWELLEARLEARVANSQTLIDEVETESTVDIENLDRISLRFKEILEEINSVDVEATEVSDLVHLYVEYKKEIIDLSLEFKNEYSVKISEEKRAELKERIEAKKEEIKERKVERLKNLKVKHSIKSLTKAYSSISGLDLEEIKTQFEAGEISVAEVKAEVKASWESLSDEEKQQAKDKLQEEKENLKTQIKERNLELREEFKERIEVLKEERKTKVQELRERKKERENNTKLNQIRAAGLPDTPEARENQEEFISIQEKFAALTPEQQENLKQRAESLSEEQRAAVDELAKKYLSGEELTEEDLAEVSVIVEANGGIE